MYVSPMCEAYVNTRGFCSGGGQMSSDQYLRGEGEGRASTPHTPLRQAKRK